MPQTVRVTGGPGDDDFPLETYPHGEIGIVTKSPHPDVIRLGQMVIRSNSEMTRVGAGCWDRVGSSRYRVRRLRPGETVVIENA